MDMYNVDVIDEMLSDVDYISEWYADIADGEKSARSFRNDTQKAIDSLKTFPSAHPMMFDDIPDVRRIHIPNHKADIVFKVYDDTLEVIAVMAYHELREPSKYLNKIQERVTIADAKIKNLDK